MKKTSTLVLDIGGIFFYPAWRLEGIAATAELLGMTETDFKQALKKNKRPFYTGAMSESDYWDAVIVASGAKAISSDDMARTYRTYVQPITETLELLPQLAEKYTLYACNNSPKEWMDYRIELTGMNRYFKKFFTSGYVGAMKPDVALYSLVFSENPQAMAYIDDDEDYIQAAQSGYGVPAYIYQSKEDLLRWIR